MQEQPVKSFQAQIPPAPPLAAPGVSSKKDIVEYIPRGPLNLAGLVSSDLSTLQRIARMDDLLDHSSLDEAVKMILKEELAGIRKSALKDVNSFIEVKEEIISCFRKGYRALKEKMQASLEHAQKTTHLITDYYEREIFKAMERAKRDPDTSLYNKRTFISWIEAILPRVQACSLVVIDVRNFKNINDTLGHKVGDIVLKVIADILKSQTRSGDPGPDEERGLDLRARIGNGDEFGIFLSNTDVAGAKRVVSRFTDSIRSYNWAAEHSGLKGRNISVDVGMVYIGSESKIRNANHILDQGLDRADKAMYWHKERARKDKPSEPYLISDIPVEIWKVVNDSIEVLKPYDK